MASKSNKLFLVIFVICSFYKFSIAADGGFNFAEENINPDMQQSHDRKPIQSPKCDKNEYLYPGDKEGSWVCDCKPGYLYHPKTDKCYRSHVRGPCASNEQLQLPKGKSIPKCVENPCRNTNEVQFRGRCYVLNSNGPCPQGQKTRQVIVVDPSSLQLICGSFTLVTRFEPEEGEEVEDAIFCAHGSKRAQNNECTPKDSEN